MTSKLNNSLSSLIKRLFGVPTIGLEKVSEFHQIVEEISKQFGKSLDYQLVMAILEDIKNGAPPFEHYVNGNVDFPSTRRHMVIKHEKCGIAKLVRINDELYMNGRKVRLCIHPKTTTIDRVGTDEFLQMLEGKFVLNISLRNYLLKHRDQLIPKHWTGFTVLFPGTHCHSDNVLIIPSIESGYGRGFMAAYTEMRRDFPPRLGFNRSYAAAVLED